MTWKKAMSRALKIADDDNEKIYVMKLWKGCFQIAWEQELNSDTFSGCKVYAIVHPGGFIE